MTSRKWKIGRDTLVVSCNTRCQTEISKLCLLLQDAWSSSFVAPSELSYFCVFNLMLFMLRLRVRTFLMPGRGWVMSLNASVVMKSRIQVWVYFRSDILTGFLLDWNFVHNVLCRLLKGRTPNAQLFKLLKHKLCVFRQCCTCSQNKLNPEVFQPVYPLIWVIVFSYKEVWNMYYVETFYQKKDFL